MMEVPVDQCVCCREGVQDHARHRARHEFYIVRRIRKDQRLRKECRNCGYTT